jgi:hypothetical protein
VISTISCFVVAGASVATWAWRGPLPLSAQEQKASTEATAERQTVNASGASGKAAPAKSGAAATATPQVKTTAVPPGTGSMPAAPAAPVMPATPPAPASAPSAAQGSEPGSPTAEASAPSGPTRPTSTLPTELVRSPSLYETGRIGKAAVNEPGVPTNRSVERAAPPEMLVEAKQPDRRDGPTPASYTGVVDQSVLDREIAPRFRLLADCKADVAHRKRVAAANIAGSTLLLRLRERTHERMVIPPRPGRFRARRAEVFVSLKSGPWEGPAPPAMGCGG